MSNFDFEHAQETIKKILAIVETCPEPLREKCFELLFNAALRDKSGVAKTKTADEEKKPAGTDEGTDKQNQDQRPDNKLPPNVLAFTRKYDVTPALLEKLFILDHEPLLPVYKVAAKNTSKAQLQKTMMVLLENGLLNGQFKASYAELRDTVKEDGLYDGNFTGLLRRHHAFFKGAISANKIDESEVVELTGEGFERLAEIVKELAQPAKSGE